MKTILKIAVVAVSLVLMLLADVPLLPVQVVPEAQAIFGVWRRHARRWAVVGTAASRPRLRPLPLRSARPPQPSSRQLRPSNRPLRLNSRRLPPTSGCRFSASRCAGCSRRETLAAGHRRFCPPRGLRLHTGRRRGVLLLRRQLLSRGVSGEQPGLCDGAAEIKETVGTIGGSILFGSRGTMSVTKKAETECRVTTE